MHQIPNDFKQKVDSEQGTYVANAVYKKQMKAGDQPIDTFLNTTVQAKNRRDAEKKARAAFAVLDDVLKDESAYKLSLFYMRKLTTDQFI